ncbi:hypothetical protein CCZ01_01845 [Helicobacter monodelphidis]|uniref:hypothetical protein n=1 Tax=Helicobacter sp. 15-1451 TaxID=2004995 RepID=UPI000DCDD418|nr:hypothetical protein [Helicobacter sp. 15-1451]RAX58958.1 hypothetical protein CCZ01_01845 [Helicobacter sp. 15-1451]
MIHSFCYNGKAGDGLVQVTQQALKALQPILAVPTRLVFVRGPGSFTAIKLAYIFAQTMRITHDIELFGVDSFALNDNAPIFAYGNSYFVKSNHGITLETYTQELPKVEMYLPNSLDSLELESNTSPLYILPAV